MFSIHIRNTLQNRFDCTMPENACGLQPCFQKETIISIEANFSHPTSNSGHSRCLHTISWGLRLCYKTGCIVQWGSGAFWTIGERKDWFLRIFSAQKSSSEIYIQFWALGLLTALLRWVGDVLQSRHCCTLRLHDSPSGKHWMFRSLPRFAETNDINRCFQLFQSVSGHR